MPAKHRILELRTSPDTLYTPDAAIQLFAALPLLKNTWWRELSASSEQLSIEICLTNQTISFQAFVPERLVTYFTSASSASYPGILITPLGDDLLEELLPNHQAADTPPAPQYLSTGYLALKRTDRPAGKTDQAVVSGHTLTPLLSTLSKLTKHDRVVVQYVMAPDSQAWKRSDEHTLSAHSRQANDQRPQKGLIKQTLASTSVKTCIKIAVSTHSAERSRLLLETVAAPLQAATESADNQLELRKVWALKPDFVRQMMRRSFRRADALRLSVQELAALVHLPNKNQAAVKQIAWGKTLAGEPPANLPIVSADGNRSASAEINPYAQTLCHNAATTYGVKRADRRRQMFIAGRAGAGKSTLLANLASRDIKNGDGVCVIDPHGDLVESLLHYIPATRIKDVVYFNPTDPRGVVAINLFAAKTAAQRELVTNNLIAIFQHAYGGPWEPRLEYILRSALLTLLKLEPQRLSDLLELLTNEIFRTKLLNNLHDPVLLNFWQHEYDHMSDKLRTEASASVLNKLGQFLSSPLVRSLVNGTQGAHDIEKMIGEGKIILANLSQHKLGKDTASILGSMLITQIQLAALNRMSARQTDRPDLYLYVDEFQYFASEAMGGLLSEARRFNLSATLACQHVASIQKTVQQAIFGNCANIVSFALDDEDAEVMEKEFAPQYSRDDLSSLGRYQIVNKLSIDSDVSRPFPATSLDLASQPNNNRNKVLRASRERYAGNKAS